MSISHGSNHKKIRDSSTFMFVQCKIPGQRKTQIVVMEKGYPQSEVL